MNRFQRTIDLSKSKRERSDEEVLSQFTSSQLAGIKNLAKRKLVEGAIDELERARPILDREYYMSRMYTLTQQLAKLKAVKKTTTRVVELHFVG